MSAQAVQIVLQLPSKCCRFIHLSQVLLRAAGLLPPRPCDYYSWSDTWVLHIYLYGSLCEAGVSPRNIPICFCKRPCSVPHRFTTVKLFGRCGCPRNHQTSPFKTCGFYPLSLSCCMFVHIDVALANIDIGNDHAHVCYCFLLIIALITLQLQD